MLSPRQDSKWHIDRYPTMSGVERGEAIGRCRPARKIEPEPNGTTCIPNVPGDTSATIRNQQCSIIRGQAAPPSHHSVPKATCGQHRGVDSLPLAELFQHPARCPRTTRSLDPPNTRPFRHRCRHASPPIRSSSHTWPACSRAAVRSGDGAARRAVHRGDCR